MEWEGNTTGPCTAAAAGKQDSGGTIIIRVSSSTESDTVSQLLSNYSTFFSGLLLQWIPSGENYYVKLSLDVSSSAI